MEQRTLEVSKWQAARPRWVYTPTLWFYYRMVEVAFLDARTSVPMIGPLREGEERLRYGTDDALLARDWIARSEPLPNRAPHEFVSFPECCAMLGLNADAERVALLAAIDAGVETDYDEAWARLDVLAASGLKDDVEPLFDAPRIVLALDQLALF